VASYQVTFVTGSEEIRIQVPDGQYLLEAGVRVGLDLPYMCLQGWCTTCAGRVLTGDYDQTEARRYFPEDRLAGFILLCSAYPRSDLRILTHQKEAMRVHRRLSGLPAPQG
jgi:ferredoxin